MSPDLLVIREEALDLAEDVRRRVDNGDIDGIVAALGSLAAWAEMKREELRHASHPDGEQP